MFKRTIREAAMKHDIYATFMAKPIQGQPGSAMHIHQSVIDKRTGANVFSEEDGTPSELFFNFIGGMQRYVPAALVMMAPYVNSYRRLTYGMSAPTNNAWGYDNRTTAFRVPTSDASGRRVENRLPSSDANPYLALAAGDHLQAEPLVVGRAGDHRLQFLECHGVTITLPITLRSRISASPSAAFSSGSTVSITGFICPAWIIPINEEKSSS